METTHYFLMLTAFLFAALVVFFQYFYKSGKISQLTYILSFLRFVSLSALLLLILNLKINRIITEIIKPKLILLADNSSSIKYKKQDAISRKLIKELSGDKEIAGRFDIKHFSFGKDLNYENELNFDEAETNIYKALVELNDLFKDEKAPVILFTDGNQTYGNDYIYLKSKQLVYPVVLGDTTRFNDLYIGSLNVNQYTYINHRFPVELFVNYEGEENINTQLQVYNRGSIVFKKVIEMSPSENSLKVSFLLPALDSGKHFYKIVLKSLDSEKNKLNNVKEFSIEVLNESSKILLLYDVLHPDIALWKRTVESNKQRKISLERIDKFKGNLTDYQFVILYQPNKKFKTVLSKKINMLIHTGTQTDWDFLNRNQGYFKKEFLDKVQLITPVYNEGFSTFLIKDIDLNKMPPLKNIFGKITFKVQHQELLFQGINNFKTELPLLTTIEDGKRRMILIDGENLFTWRNYTYLENRSFQDFDLFTNSLFQFLQDQGNRKTLEVDFKPIYFENEEVIIRAGHYTSDYQLDTVSRLSISVYNENKKEKKSFPMYFDGNTNEIRFQNLEPGVYNFKIYVTGQNKSFRGKFKILDFNQEQQSVRSDVSSLKQLAEKNDSRVYFPDKIDKLKEELLSSDRFKSLQKEVNVKQSLIDWKWLLSLIILSLSIEWFIRKYHGLI